MPTFSEVLKNRAYIYIPSIEDPDHLTVTYQPDGLTFRMIQRASELLEAGNVTDPKVRSVLAEYIRSMVVEWDLEELIERAPEDVDATAPETTRAEQEDKYFKRQIVPLTQDGILRQPATLLVLVMTAVLQAYGAGTSQGKAPAGQDMPAPASRQTNVTPMTRSRRATRSGTKDGKTSPRTSASG